MKKIFTRIGISSSDPLWAQWQDSKGVVYRICLPKIHKALHIDKLLGYDRIVINVTSNIVDFKETEKLNSIFEV